MKKLAFVGTSPITLLLATAMCEENEVTIFEEQKSLGGAWAQKKICHDLVNTKSNIIVTQSKHEEKWVNVLNEYLLENFAIEASRIEAPIKLGILYSPPCVYEYELRKLFEVKKPNLQIRHERVNQVAQTNSGAQLNGESFDKLFLPTYCGVDNIDIANQIHNTQFSTIASKHLNIVFTADIPNQPYYQEDAQFILDRVQYKKFARYNIMIGRIAKDCKEKPVEELVEILQKHFDFKKIVYQGIETYKNYFRTNDEILSLKNTLAICPNIQYMETAQFFDAFIRIYPRLKT